MKRIKGINGYTIFQAGPRDASKNGFEPGRFYVYFSGDVRDYGLLNSTPEFEDCGSIEEAEAHCTGNFAIAKEIVEAQTTAAGMDEILEIETLLNDGADPNEVAEKLERIEEARQLAHDLGLPFSSRSYEDELDPYVYDGSMSSDDYELMTQRRQAHQELEGMVAAHWPDMPPEKIDEFANAALGLNFSPEKLEQILASFAALVSTVKQIVEKLLEGFRPIAEWVAKVCRQLTEATMYTYAPPKWWHYYKHAKKFRVRKKYERRIRASMMAAIRVVL